MATGLEGLDPGTVEALAASWARHLALEDRDPRLVDLAMNRALKLPDDATSWGRRLMLQEHAALFGLRLSAMFEQEFTQVAARYAGHDRDGSVDSVVGWIVTHRDQELFRSREWWALERLRLDYLSRWRQGSHPRNP
jgi:hypothetical protein